MDKGPHLSRLSGSQQANTVSGPLHCIVAGETYHQKDPIAEVARNGGGGPLGTRSYKHSKKQESGRDSQGRGGVERIREMPREVHVDCSRGAHDLRTKVERGQAMIEDRE